MSARRFTRQHGVALIIVLMAFALGSILASGMLSRQSIMIRGATTYLAQNDARSLALGAEAFARQFLARDLEGGGNTPEENQEGSQGTDQEGTSTRREVDHPSEEWARSALALPVDKGVIEAQINDLQGRLNLNALTEVDGSINQLQRNRLQRLLRVLEIRNVRPETFVDWVDADDERTGAAGAEDSDYMLLDPPYRAADQPFVSVTEVRLLDGMTEAAYQRLRPHVTALPNRDDMLNVNFASTAVLRSLHDRISQGQAESIRQTLRESPVESVEEFLALPEFAGLGLESDGLGVSTNFFEIAARVSVSGTVYRLVSKAQRTRNGTIRILSRDTGRSQLITKEQVQASE
ncbi:type II secretion system minor pseudopilin GspK [Vreelandella utahensis]|uniref:type II secretion system minor pseudopilin GspK n=1 Tax=Vreelandella halophila TaxID=86177 RepID=UPI000987BD8C|nr:type II secretion system minor pseudopilin GspK [Halomonas utahensis]